MKKQARRLLYLMMFPLLLAATVMGHPGPAGATTPVTLADLAQGDKVIFAGYSWIVLNPGTGYLLMQGSYGEPMPFDSGTLKSPTVTFDPSRPTNIACYLNHVFYDSLPRPAQSMIQPVPWLPDVSCKIGLLSYGDYRTYKAVADVNVYFSWWTRSVFGAFPICVVPNDTPLDDPFPGADAVSPAYFFAVRPALYLSPGDLVLGGIVLCPPTVIKVSPASGPTTGGTAVTISGNGFTGTTKVSFGGTATTAFTLRSDTLITATTPAVTEAEAAHVTVTNPVGTSQATGCDEFTYTPPAAPAAPTVTGISPRTGPAAGGTAAEITGTNFTAGATVMFGSTSAAAVTFNSPVSLTATAPAGTGTVDVTVSTPGGTSITSSTDRFTYTPPAPSPTAGQTVLRFSIGSRDCHVNDQVQHMDTTPLIRDSRTLLPIRYVAAPLGATVTWERSARKVTVRIGGKTIELWIGRNTATVNGVATPVDPANPDVAPVIIPPGRTLVPLRFIAENMGCRVDWDQARQMVTLTYPKP